MIEVMDEGVGKVIDLLYELNIYKNTIIFFFSDNGGTRNGNNGPYRGYKGSLYEGGHRVASMVWSPSIIKKGIQSDETFMTIDILPTISDFIGENINHSLDGVSMKKHIMLNQEINDRLLFWEHNSNYAVRKNNWKLLKLIKNNKIELYDLSNDLQEKNDVSALHPELVKELLYDIEKWKKDISNTSNE
jgi:arylsulfatase A-like enzyme